MIAPSFSLTSTERVLPRMALDFTTAALDPRVTFTRSGNTATVTNSSGVISAINADLPRFDYDPTTLICKGLLIEESRTNSLLNSLLDGSDLSTQSVVVTAQARTLSFYGDGTVVLSGAHSATVVGVGAYPARTTLAFTPSAGLLVLTVTGTVQFANLELGAFATSFIPTDGTTKTRNADVATMTGTNFSDWYNQTEGAFYVSASSLVISASPAVSSRPLTASDGTTSNALEISISSVTALIQGYASTVFQGSSNVSGTYTGGVVYPQAAGYKINSVVCALNGTLGSVDTAFTIPTVNRLRIGAGRAATAFHNGHIQKIMYWPQRITNAEVAAFSK
jgi:hypothetical protein